MKSLCSRVMSPIGDITLISLTNSSGASVTLSSLGAGIVGIKVPDRNGHLDDVVLGYANPVDYINDGPCAGKTPGRYANRISNARFILNGNTYRLPQNDGANSLHGGINGFMNRIWDVETSDAKVIFSYTSADGEEGYPGQLKVTVTYEWTDDCRLIITFNAVTDSPTIINLTNHAYFNLNGEDSGSIFDHTLHLYASSYLPVDSCHIPTGEIAPTCGTPMDFSTPKKIGHDINADFEAVKIGRGYNHFWILDGDYTGELKKGAELFSEKSGRLLEVYTTQRGIQIYTGGWLNDSPKSHSGRSYNNHDGVALECQGFTDAPNHPNFPSQILLPGEKYDQTIIYQFKTV